MSSKLLYDEKNPNLQKQIGCMNGFLQKIYCHQFLTGRRVKTPPIPGTSVAKEKQRGSTESSRTSFSSSSCSSSFSSLECNRIDSHFHGQAKSSSPNPLPISLKDSVYRASSELSVKTTKTQEKQQNHIFKHVDSPRPLQSQSQGLRDAPRFSFDGRVSHDTFKSLKIKELPRLSLDSRQSTMRATSSNPQQELSSFKRQSSVVVKLMGLEAFPVEESQFKAYPDEKVGSLSRSASNLSGIEFRKSGKDLRALKRVLEAMHKTAEMSERRNGHSNDQSSESLVQEKLQRSLNMIMKPTRPVKKKQPTRRGDHVSADRAQASRSMQTLKESMNSKSPRLEKKQSDSRMSRKQISSQETESGFPRTKQKPKSPNSQQRSSKVRDLRSHGNAKSTCSASHIETEGTSTKKNLEFKLRAMAEPAGVTSEQPSPISVLNPTFYRDESPSPVKKAPTIIKDDEPRNSAEAEWLQSDHNKSKNTTLTLLAEDSNQEHRYIYTILSASGLIRDLDTVNGKAVIPMSLQVFLKVEQTQFSRNTSHQNPVQKIRRKLVFDVVNEIIEHKLSPNKLGKGRRRRRLQGEQLLRELCSEIDQLEADEDDDGLRRILCEDLMHRSTEWEDYAIEISGIVSDIERLIFKELIGEVVNGETAGLRIRLCRQLFYQ